MSGYISRMAPEPRPEKEYVYSLDVIYPPGAIIPTQRGVGFPVVWQFNPDWKPDGWVPDEDYIAQFGTVRFIWPKVRRIYASRSSAVTRADLLEHYGATVRVLRSQRIDWEEAPRRKKPVRTLEEYFFGEEQKR